MGGLLSSPEVVESLLTDCDVEHGGECVSPGAHGGVGGSPANPCSERTDNNMKERASRFRFMLFSYG